MAKDAPTDVSADAPTDASQEASQDVVPGDALKSAPNAATKLTYVACLPLIAADLPAVLALDQRCLGGLWTRSGYQRELDSDHSDLLVMVGAASLGPIANRRGNRQTMRSQQTALAADLLADFSPGAADPTENPSSPLRLLGIGCLWAILDEAHITTLAIDVAYQRQKFGQLLLVELLRAGGRRGLTRATLEVRAANERALNLYQKFSFREAGQRRRYYSDGENARVLWRSGLQSEDCKAQIERQRQQAIAHLSAQSYQYVDS